MAANRKVRRSINATKKWTERPLAPLALVACLLGLITGAIDAVVKVGQFLSAQRLLTMSTLWIAAVLIAWRGIPPTTRLLGLRGRTVQIVAIAIGTGLFAFVGVYPEIRTRWLDQGPAKSPDLSPAGAIHGDSAYAATTTPFVIERIYVNDELSSFEETSGYEFSRGRVKDPIRTFAYNERVKAARESGRCISAEGNRLIVNVLPLLQERAQRMNRQDLRSLVDDVDSYRRMMSRGADRFSQLLFTQIEIDRMRQTDPAAFKIVSQWLVDCVGVQNPVLTIEVRNLSSESVLLTALHYAVEDADIVLGGEAGPLTPAYTYDHVLPHARGVHRRPLVPAFSLKPRSLGAFNVVVRPADRGAGQAWVLRIRLRDNGGNEASSDRFQLIMSKLER
jgi:hypothetical protein